MRTKELQTTTHQLPSNIVAFMTAPSVPVDPILEISTLYNVDQYYACDIYETVGDDYTNEALVAAMCGIASPETKGGLSC